MSYATHNTEHASKLVLALVGFPSVIMKQGVSFVWQDKTETRVHEHA